MKDLERLFGLIDDIEIAMLTTRRADGHLQSRAMATQAREPGADLWFVTGDYTHKLDDLEHDPHVNVSYYKDRTREWVSVSGVAHLSRDRALIGRLWRPDWEVWFPKGNDPRHGTPDDPRLVLLGIDIHAAVFFEVDKPQPIVLYEMAKGWLTGETPDLGEMRRVGPQG